tara:strand:+ start:2553 stop:3551 length:999 start_codon:yes stop_codon:yes gene_type:complete
MTNKNNIINFEKILKLAREYGINTVENVNELNIKINNVNYQKIRNVTSGSYGIIDLFRDQSNNLVINKKAIEKKGEKNLIKEITINSILSAFQYLYLRGYGNNNNIFYPKLVPRVVHVYDNESENSKNLIIDKYDGDVFNYFKNIDLADPIQELIFIDFLYKIACKLKLLQKYFYFMHNDLKATNIFYKLINPNIGYTPNNLRYVIGDFGGSCMVFDGKLIKGDMLGISSSFKPGKDIFMLLHIMITYIKTEYKSSFSNYVDFLFGEVDFNNSEIEDDKWHSFYTRNDYPESYSPENIINKIIEIYPSYDRNLNCLNVTGSNFTNKYKINYN